MIFVAPHHQNLKWQAILKSHFELGGYTARKMAFYDGYEVLLMTVVNHRCI